MILTVQFGLRRPGIRKLNIFNLPDHPVTFIYLGFGSVGVWRGNARSLLVKAVIGLQHDPEWIAKNWPTIRRENRKGYAKGRAQGKAAQFNWEERCHSLHSELTACQIEKNRLADAVNVLRERGILPSSAMQEANHD